MNRITVLFALAGLALFTGCSDSPTGPGPEQYAGVWTGTRGSFCGSFNLICGGSYIIGTGSPLSSGTWEATR